VIRPHIGWLRAGLYVLAGALGFVVVFFAAVMP